jgi:hypothetical protein
LDSTKKTLRGLQFKDNPGKNVARPHFSKTSWEWWHMLLMEAEKARPFPKKK